MQYCKQYAHDHELYSTYNIFGKDYLGFIIYEKKLIRFTNFHLVYNSEAIFYNILLQKITFCNEKNMFSENNIEKSYVRECQIREFLHNVESLQTYLIQYENQNLFENKK
jgi:hypothetical protein